MARSMRLGHCICDPKKSCPCDVLRDHDVCPCAGERLEMVSGELRLTELVERPGCASKIDAAALRKILAELPTVNDPRVLVGMPAGDDAGVYQLDGELALVQTVDVFSPSVDDPYLFGQIAAANSVSDIYAMGGRPITALSIVGFPIRVLADDVLQQILRGGIDKMNEAGVAVIGGHSINDREIKAGFAVTGLIEPEADLDQRRPAAGRPADTDQAAGHGYLGVRRSDRPRAGGCAGGGGAVDGSVEPDRCGTDGRVRRSCLHRRDRLRPDGTPGRHGRRPAASTSRSCGTTCRCLPGVLQCLADGIVSGAVERNRESFEQHVRCRRGRRCRRCWISASMRRPRAAC